MILCAHTKTNQTNRTGFTIVELLVVVVVIAILASITTVVFAGINQRALESSMATELNNAKKKILLFQAEHGSLPTAINCPNPSVTEVCIESSELGELTYSYSNASNPQQFTLNLISDTSSYHITEESLPAENVKFVTNGLTAYLDAGNPASYTQGAITWQDISGSGRNASLTSVTYSPDDGGALVFDGSTSMGLLASGQTRSVFMFVYPNVILPSPGWQYVLDARTGASNGYLSNTAIGSWANFRINNQPATTAWSSIPQNQWISFYADIPTTATSTISIFSRYTANEVFRGKIGIFMVYNRPLTAYEVSQNFNALRLRFGL